jgi:hypothetical protein
MSAWVKTQVHNPLGSFLLSLPGTNSLEGLFGKVRTIQGNDLNVDQLQLKSWAQQVGDVSAKIDHINPPSWQGDISVKNVVLMTCWSKGC